MRTVRANRVNRISLKSRINRIRKIKASVIWLFVLLCSCSQPAYEQYQVIRHDSWEKDQEYYFTFDIADTTVPYDLTLEIRNTNLYPFQNLWLLLNETYPDSTARRDTTELILADDFGKWYGKGISVFQSSHPVRTRFLFPQKGKYIFGLRQGMRQDKLPGIQGIGFRVEKSDKVD